VINTDANSVANDNPHPITESDKALRWTTHKDEIRNRQEVEIMNLSKKAQAKFTISTPKHENGSKETGEEVIQIKRGISLSKLQDQLQSNSKEKNPPQGLIQYTMNSVMRILGRRGGKKQTRKNRRK
jgi:hypothetical protein